MDKILVSIATALAAKLIPVVVKAIGDELEERIPGLIAAVVKAITDTLSSVAVTTTDRVTDAIPGRLDDAVFDTIVERAVDIFKGFNR